MYEVVSPEKQILAMICREEDCGRLVTRSAVFILCLSLCRRWLQRCSDSLPYEERVGSLRLSPELLATVCRRENCGCLIVRLAVYI